MVAILESLHENLLLINANEETLPNEFGIHDVARKRERRSVISKITSIQTESESSWRTVKEGNEDMQTIITEVSTQGTTKKDATELQIRSNQMHSSNFNGSEKMKTSTQQNYTPTKLQNSSQRNVILNFLIF